MSKDKRSNRRQTKARVHHNRLRFLALSFVLVSSGYTARLVQLQVLDAQEWRGLSQLQNAERAEVPAPRGGIFDRSGTQLVRGSQDYRAYLAPEELRNQESAVDAVGRALGLSRQEEARLRAATTGWEPIRRKITSADLERLQSLVRQGLYVDTLFKRVYPEGVLARSLLGTIDQEGRGVSGLEAEFDTLLAGTPGSSLYRKDALGHSYLLPGGELLAPRAGRDVYLTIDAELQAIAEHALDRGLAETGASGGDVLILNPRTGEVLAVASRRGSGFQSVPAFTDPYEPGSTLKPFLLSALLAEDIVDLSDTVDVENGLYRVGRRLIQDVHPYDRLSVAEVVSYSSNIGAAKLASRLQPGEQYRYLRDFGFGVQAGIEHPAEASGLLRRPSSWSALSQASLAMGYEISVTSLQLAAAYGALANGGTLMRPYLVSEIRDADGRTVYQQKPETIRRVIDRDVAEQVCEVLASVVSDGTGTRAALAVLPVAGKTGTARLISDGRYERRYAASFVGFAPADDPRLVILTKLEDPQGAYYGGSVAAPIIQETLQAALATRGVVLDRESMVRPVARRRWGTSTASTHDSGPFIFAVGTQHDAVADEQTNIEESMLMPDLAGLPIRAAAKRLHELGLKVTVTATGKVRHQEPAPGRTVAPGATVVLR